MAKANENKYCRVCKQIHSIPMCTRVMPPRECEDCGEVQNPNERRIRCKHCGLVVCSWCYHHVHQTPIIGPHPVLGCGFEGKKVEPLTKRKREIPIKEILADGTMVNMTKKEAAEWRKSIKSTIRDASGGR